MHTHQGKRAYRSREEMFPLIERWQSSGQTQQRFCEEQGISLAVFGYWLRKYRELSDSDTESDYAGEAAPGFIPLQLETALTSQSIALEVQLPNGVLLRFQRLPPQNYLNGLFTGL